MKVLSGTFRSDRANADAPDPGALANVPRPPPWLGKGARRHFKRLAERAIGLQVLADTDIEALALAAAALEEYLQADELVRTHGLTFMSENGPKKHPAVAVRSDAWRRYRDALRSFGFTPADRDHVAKAKSGRPRTIFPPAISWEEERRLISEGAIDATLGLRVIRGGRKS